MDEAGHLSAFLAPRLSSPIWHRALRLYGIHLLEQSDNLTKWSLVLATAGSIPSPIGTLAQDILLESTAFSSASGTSLLRNGLWPLLAEHGGRLLVRLLNRLFHTATFPNPTVVEAIVQQAPEFEIHASAGARLPYPPYWFGILALLHAHREEVPARARGLAARVADLWLRSTDQGWAFRREAAELAVALAENMLREKEECDRFFSDGEIDQQIYRALLAAGYEQPEAIAQIALEASGRRQQRFSPPPLSEEELTSLRANRPKFPSLVLGGAYEPLPAPWPHGPEFRVDGALQKVVLGSDALRPLADALPELAREVLLALLIAEPRLRSFDGDLGGARFELEWPQWYPIFYTQGPFRYFLAVAETEAVTAILQLIDHATDRWVESTRRYLARNEECSPTQVETPTISIEVDDKKVDFIGDADVFSWCQHGADSGGVIGSSLAALEKYLYDRVDSDADVTPLVLRLLRESRSLAIVGLLSVFGRRHFYYLRGPLRGLLVSPYLLQWTLMGSNHIMWELSLSDVPKPLREEYRAWHEMHHRKTSLHGIAQFLFVNDLSLRPFFEKAREELRAGLQPGGPYQHWPLVESLVSLLDPSNYSELEHEDGTAYSQYSPPEELLKKYANEEGRETRALLMTLPLECRRLLDDPEPVLSQKLDELWAAAQRISQLEPVADDDMASPANARAGIAAVLVQHGREWYSEHPDRAEWARRTILDAAQEVRESKGLYKNVAWGRLAFAVETLPTLWAEDPDDHETRKILALLVLKESPELVGKITDGVAAVRGRLGEDHLRLLRAVLLRAALEPKIREASRRERWDTGWNEIGPPPGREQDDPAEDLYALLSEMDAVERAFVERTLKAAVPSLEEVAPLQPLTGQGVTRHPHRRRTPYRLIEESLLTATYRGVPNPSGAENHWLSVWERIVLDTVGPLAQADNEQTEDLEERPRSWGQYLMGRVAGVVAEIDDPAAAQRLWQPIIDLGASASQWVEWFAQSWIRYALYRDAREPVVESWLAMIDAALTNSHWKAGNGYTMHFHSTGELWRALLGIEQFGADVWTDEIRPRVRYLHSRFALWAESHLANSRSARSFANWLTLPAAADLVFDGLIWLERESQLHDDRFWGRQENDLADAAVFSLLAHVWAVAREPLRRDETAFRGFRNLLQILVSRQHAPALELSDRVGSVAY